MTNERLPITKTICQLGFRCGQQSSQPATTAVGFDRKATRNPQLHIVPNVNTHNISSAMGNVKAKTHLEKLGFIDSDKKEPKHQQIQIWVYENIDKVLKETVMAKNEFPYEITKNKWEHEVVYESGNYKLLVGFIDILAQVRGTFNFKHGNDILCDEMELNVYIEIKSAIPDLGALIRQMRAYQTYNSSFAKYLIISPDDTFVKILNEQGFYFYKYKDPSLLF